MQALRTLLGFGLVVGTVLLAAGGAAAASTEEVYGGTDPYWTTGPPAPAPPPDPCADASNLTRCYYSLFPGAYVRLSRTASMFGD